MHISWEIITASLGTASDSIRILIPGGKSSNSRAVGSAVGLDNGTIVTPMVVMLPGTDVTKIFIFRDVTATNTWAAQTNTLTCRGSITFETT